MTEVEKKLKLLRMNWFLKNQENASRDQPDGSKPERSVRAEKLVAEIEELRADIRQINEKMAEYQRDVTAKESNVPDGRKLFPAKDISYMYPVPPEVQILLSTGKCMYSNKL